MIQPTIDISGPGNGPILKSSGFRGTHFRGELRWIPPNNNMVISEHDVLNDDDFNVAPKRMKNHWIGISTFEQGRSCGQFCSLSMG